MPESRVQRFCQSSRSEPGDSLAEAACSVGIIYLFESEYQLLGVFKTCDDYPLPGHDADGLREIILETYGAWDNHLEAGFELDLVRYIDMEFHEPYGIEEGGWLELTDLGRQFIEEIEKK